jgi:large subunit ribosomal protein L3
MINTILGLKKGSSQTFLEGFRIPVTKMILGPCTVTQVKRIEKDGYWAVQLAFATRSAKNTSKPLQGHLKKSQTSETKNQSFPRFLREVRFDKEPEFKVGDQIKVSDVLSRGDIVSVSGISKGKGFAGVVKRHHFRGGPRTHGQSDRERAPGSVGQTTTPGRVYKGKRMAGRMGGVMTTIKNLHIVSVNPETNEVEVSGQVPGAPGSLVVIKKIKSGSLSELEKETVAQVVEGTPSAPEEASSVQGSSSEQPKSGKPVESEVKE